MKNLFLILFFISTAAFSQNTRRKYISHALNGNNLEISTSDGKYSIKFYSPEIAETTFIPTGETFNPESHAVVLQPQKIQPRISTKNGFIEFATDGLSISIAASPFEITYTYKQKQLLSEKNGYTKTDSTETIDFNLDPSEVLYGGGARVLGMNRRGNRLQLYNRAHYGYGTRSELMNFTMPIVMSSNIYAVHFDNAPIGVLDLDSKKNNTLTYETITGRKTYQVIAGDSWDKLIENYTLLTGRQPMPPRWAFGNFASRFGYHSERETRATVAKFAAEKIPLDAIILDLYWFGKDVKGTMGNLEFDRDSFPNPQSMMSDFNKQGIKTILITEPFVLTTSNKWQEAVSKSILATDKAGNPFTYDFYFGNTGLIDIFKPEGRDWFWDIYKKHNQMGVAGWWGDLGEPEVHPSALQHATGSADELHNIYGHNWAELVFEGYKRDFPQQRPFILMRSGYSGSQRYGMLPWSGDVSRSWDGLSGQPEISLQMGMQGMAYMHSDLGGFAGANLDNELYIRWLQYGVFQPIFRPHAQEDVAAEPVFREEKTKALAKKAVELRYRLMPYNYTMAFENNQHGTPLMRPIFFEEPDNTDILASAQAYFWGNDFLISPVLSAGVTLQNIYFPKSGNWYDFHTYEVHKGGQTAAVSVSKDHIPVFVRAGAFIPMTPVIQSTKDYNLSQLELHYFYDASAKESKSSVYNDDGSTPEAFEKGRYEILHLQSNSASAQVTFSIRHEVGKSYTPQDKNVRFIVHGLNKKPAKAIYNGKKSKFKWDKKTNNLEIPLLWRNQSSGVITIQLAK
ncbi:MAG TPA: TIM-barrel domain-containing protein [Flavobacterium sp.]|jgi:alpha-glucosidase (family GH31 glycosyl hydrolase)